MSRLLAPLAVLLAGCLSAAAKAPATEPARVVVAAVDIPAGTTVTFDMITQRAVAAAIVTSSIVKPESASYIVNQRIQMPALAGDALLWSMFETPMDQAAIEACANVLGPPSGDAASQVAQARAIALER